MTRSAACTAVTAAMLSLCVDVPDGRPQAGASFTAGHTVVSATQRVHLDARSTLRDLLRHPAFAGFAHLILPWDDRAYDEQMPLTRIGSLLPYHTHVDPETVATGLNRMIDDAASGKTVFYRFYSDAQTQQQPAKSKTGLFFFRGRPGAPFAVIAPGGGFSYVASVHEGFPYAVAISSKGYNAFVLKYRAGHGGTVATQDLAAAVSYILENAAIARRQHHRILAVGEFGGRENGRLDRFARRGELWRRERSKAVSRRDGVHRAFGLRVRRASHVRRGG